MVLLKILAQIALGLFLLSAGISHLGSNREEFLAQVPTWQPLNADFVVVASGLVEITVGILLITTLLIFKKYRQKIGLITGIFFILIFPGNINQYVNQIDAFGLDTDSKRLIRLFLQPVLVGWALWSADVISLTKKLNNL